MSASGGISLDLAVVFVVVVVVAAFWNSVSSDVQILLRLQRDTCTTALILLMLRGPSPSIILYFQTEEGGAAKKN